MPWGWEFPVKADSVVSSIIPRVSNSPHRENLSLISPACLTVLTGRREKLQSVKWIPWESAELGKKKTILPKKCPLHKSLEPPTTPGTTCAASMGYCRCVCSGFQRFANLYERQQNCQSVLPDYCTSCRQLPCLWPEHFIKGYSLCLKSFSSLYDPLFHSWLRALDIHVIQICPHEIPKALLSVILQKQIACLSELDQQCFPLPTPNASEALNCCSDSLRQRPD